MQTQAAYIRDQLKFAKEGADNLARRHGYLWTEWLKGRAGKCTAAFERDGERYSLSFSWIPSSELGELAKYIEQMDHCMCAAQKEFSALKLGMIMKERAMAGAMN